MQNTFSRLLSSIETSLTSHRAEGLIQTHFSVAIIEEYLACLSF
jgi:hypothetical protein